MTTENTTATSVVTRKFTYHFRAFDEGSKGAERLSELLQKGALAQEDIEVITKEGETTKYKRKPVEVSYEVPMLEIAGLTTEQGEHVQAAIEKVLKEAQNNIVDDGMVEAFVPWDVVLAQPFTQRQAAVKVTAEMVEATCKLLSATMLNAGMAEQGVKAIAAMGTKRFSVAACSGVKASVLERIQGVLAQFVEIIAEDVAVLDTHTPVLSLWAGNIEKVLKPKEVDLDEDLFAM